MHDSAELFDFSETLSGVCARKKFHTFPVYLYISQESNIEINKNKARCFGPSAKKKSSCVQNDKMF